MLNRKLPYVMAAALMSFAAFSLPAEAQRWDNGYGYGYGYGSGRFDRFGNIDNRQTRIYSSLTRGLNSGRLTQFEYNRLLARYNQLNVLENQLRMGGLNFRERQRLTARLNMLENQLQRDLNDRQFAGRPGRWY
ncbi:MAG: hypothetical protein K2W95_11725 [Candidatus Obscuribacterales bacterium]|nr:hypothetical protein [Candidatus Obscuribacterales bacterium]